MTSRYSPDTIRENDDRLRNVRVLTEELGLVLEELAEMEKETREAAVDHHRHALRLMERMREEAGELGLPPHIREDRRQKRIREILSNGRGP